MLQPRVTALALSALLLAVSASSLQSDPADASLAATESVAAPRPAVADPGAEPATASTRAGGERRTKVRSQLLPATELTEPANGDAAVRRLGDDLATVARTNGLSATKLRTTLRHDETLWVAPSGQLVVKEQAHAGETFASAEVAPLTAPLDQTLALHSKPGSQHSVYLDFDGVDITADSTWSTSWLLAPGTYEGWDPMGDGPGFSDAERTAIQDIWARVAEDFAPFDIDVTTADPGDAALRHDGFGDTAFGTRLVVTDSLDAPATLCASQCGGVAGIGQVDHRSDLAEPAWVFAELVSQSPKSIAEAASHEVGHTFGLYHDGLRVEGGEDIDYYTGHGTWAPIMGAAYNAPVTQWSRGFYDGANNNQNDVAIIGSIAGFRTDEGGDGWGSPLRVTDATAFVTAENDGDVYLVDDCTPGARAAAVTAGNAANLDVNLTLARPSGNGAAVLKQVNPLVTKIDGVDQQPWYGEGVAYLSSTAAGLDADVDLPEGGPWLIEVRSGEGLISDDWATDYSTDGSLGAYHLVVEGCSTPDVVPARPTGLTLTTSGADLVATWAPPANSGGLPLTGYRLTINGTSPVDVAAAATTYTFVGAATTNATVEVRAVNAIGAGAPATATSNPTTVPSQVTDVTVVTDDVTCDFGGGNIQRCISVSWSNPASTGGAALTGYELQQWGDGEWFTLFPYPTYGGAGYERTSTKFNPIAGEKVSYRIVAINANGAGAPYDFEALLKGQPTRITPTITTDRDARTVKVEWETPFDGGEPIQKIFLTLTTGNFQQPVAVTLPAGTTTYTFTGVKTGGKHVLLAASNVWGPVDLTGSSRAQSDTTFAMPPISPDPGPIPLNTIRVTAADKATGSLRVAWDPAVPVDPVHDPILWYDVCVDVIGEIYLPGGAVFGDGTTRGTDLCYDRTTVALTADATSQPYIDLTGLSVGDHYVTVTPVNPGGPAYLPSMALVDFKPTAITCPATYTYENNQYSWRWEWYEMNVNYWSVRARRAPDTAWTVWSANQPYNQTAFAITPGQWEIEVTAHLRSGRTGAPVVCGVTVPETPPVNPPVDPPVDPPVNPPVDPPTTPPVPTVPDVPTTPNPPTGPTPLPPAPVLSGPAAPGLPVAKPGSKGGAATVVVSWAAPRSAGSSPVTTYEVVVYKLKNGKPVVASRTSVPASKRSLELKLKAGSYQFAVRARNAVGWSAPSALSKAVAPR